MSVATKTSESAGIFTAQFNVSFGAQLNCEHWHYSAQGGTVDVAA
jgi:hypothetical protein